MAARATIGARTMAGARERRGDAAVEFVQAVGRVLGYLEDVDSLRDECVDPVRFRKEFLRAVKLEVCLQASQSNDDKRAVYARLLSDLEEGVATGQQLVADFGAPPEADG